MKKNSEQLVSVAQGYPLTFHERWLKDAVKAFLALEHSVKTVAKNVINV